MSTPVDRLPGELVRGHETEAAVRAVAIVVEQPVVHGDLDVVVVMEVPAVGELLPEARVEALDDAVLPGAARIDGDGLDAQLGHDPGHVLDRLLLLPHLRRVGRRQQVQLVPPALERGGADVHLLADLGGRTASVVLLDGPYPGLLRVVFVSHYGGVLVFLGWVVNTP